MYLLFFFIAYLCDYIEKLGYGIADRLMIYFATYLALSCYVHILVNKK